MARDNRVYSSADVTINWNGVDLSYGWAEDTFLEVSPVNARRTVKWGSDGNAAVSKMAAKGATITLTTQASSPVNDEIRKISAAQDLLGADLQISPFVINDPSGSVRGLASNAVLTEIPSSSLGNEVGELTWTWIATLWITTDDVESVKSAINDYLPS